VRIRQTAARVVYAPAVPVEIKPGRAPGSAFGAPEF
jgi:hypothetical protein